MNHSQHQDPLTSILHELESLLKEETFALKRLDRPAIDEFATRKLELFERLSKAIAECPPAVEHKPLLERVHRLALMNQLLLVHARDAVRGALSMLAGEATVGRPSRSHAPAGAMRLNLRG